MNPFDLPGPQFLGLFIGGSAVALVVAIATKYMLARAAKPAPGALDQLRPEQLAYLVGGLDRAVEAAVAGLVHRGALVIEDDAINPVVLEPELLPDGTYRGIVDHRDLSELERFVLAEMSCGGMTVGALLDRARSFESALREPLVADLLLVTEPNALQIKAMVPALLWCAVGGIKILIGFGRGRPVGFLVLLVIALFVLARSITKAPRRTTRGDDLVRDAELRYAALEVTAGSAPAQLSGRDMVLAYATFGAAIVAPALAAFMPSYQRALLPATTRGSWISSCSSSCGSSCGGGCGSGCGGCS